MIHDLNLASNATIDNINENGKPGSACTTLPFLFTQLLFNIARIQEMLQKEIIIISLPYDKVDTFHFLLMIFHKTVL